ncbi:S-adenosyl-L-methionine-dependent methyltransferases superfamily protein [Klebsormidium nitens]|uniref:S-adenosyl-L-methionine-dependent methyltransferases superfamily protein n=1 Tax=Klebsormidium nitens TaxID=105231 RepID=A0A1Y1IBH1_KLENI|nr:S-adenosyl-L-methionine-dependent methyltransferases superfamily protein [Klebsormidium nitens]|eukprot:GAQ87913.1 S-adenosyl-L-methionine-dependent methyltransferases superfamily protein [Klebsormidium nitens]
MARGGGRKWRNGSSRGGHGGATGGGGGDGKRGRAFRRDFGKGENVWKRPRTDAAATDGPEGEKPQGENKSWAGFQLDSPAFEEYYKRQHIIADDEWDSFMATLKKTLPTTFRINGHGDFAHQIREQMQKDFFDFLPEDVEVDGEKFEAPRPLPWYPDNLAWHMSVSRNQLRKLDILENIHEFLKRENDAGNITRQEAVSMVPPLFLDVQPHHRVLDMCAAPGSKTAQLLEMLHAGDASATPQGFVVANDNDVQRCHLLIHQTKRMSSPSIMVTNHDAQNFPLLRRRGRGGAGDDGLMFDRILCDVPCSGDGTLRKAPDIWRKWTVGSGNGLHRLQLQIALRGLALLRVGGILVYSTCSLNPIEDEAVVAQLLRVYGDSLELLDVSAQLPELKRRPGLTKWLVLDKKRWYSNYSQVLPISASRLTPTMFPNPNAPAGTSAEPHVADEVAAKVAEGDGEGASLEGISREAETIEEGVAIDGAEADKEGQVEGGVVDEGGEGENAGVDSGKGKGRWREQVVPEAEECGLPLHRSMRVVPHDQDTGGFFVAVFRKLKHLEEPVDDGERKRNRGRGRGRGGRGQADGPRDQDAPEDQPVEETEPVEAENGGTETEAPETEAATAIREEDDAGDGLATDGTGVEEGLEQGLEQGLGAEVDGSAVEAGGPEAEPLEMEDAPPATEEVPRGEELAAEEGGGAGPSGGQNQGSGPRHGVRRIQQQGRWRGVDPVLELDNKEVLDSLGSYYGFKEEFAYQTQLITRSDDMATCKRIYYVSKSLLDILRLNNANGNPIKITSVGTKMFERQTVKDASVSCAYRIVLEGLPFALPYITRQIVYPDAEDFHMFLSKRSVPLTGFKDPELVQALQQAQSGCVIMAMRRAAGENTPRDAPPAAVACWRGANSINVLVTKADVLCMLDRLGFSHTSEGPSDAADPAADTIATTEPVEEAPAVAVEEEALERAEAAPSDVAVAGMAV